MQFSKSPPLFLPCTPADNDANHSYEKDFRKFSLSSYHGVVAAGRTLRGKETGPETAVSAADRVRTQRRPTLHVAADVYANWCKLTHTLRTRLFAIMYTSLTVFIYCRYKSVAGNVTTRYAVPIYISLYKETVLKHSPQF